MKSKILYLGLIAFLAVLFLSNAIYSQEDALVMRINGKTNPPPDTLCKGETMAYTGSATGGPTPITYPNPRWTGSATAYCAPLNTNITIFDANAAPAGTYILTYNAFDGLMNPYSVSITIIVDEARALNKVLPSTAFDTTICMGTSTNLSVTGAASYFWYVDSTGGGYGTVPFANTATVTVTPYTVGAYKYRVDGFTPLGCPTNPEYIEFTVNADQPPTVDAGPDQTICATGSATLAGSIGGSATSATWTGGSGTYNPNNTTLNAVYTPSPSEVAAGTVTLTLITNDPPGPCTAASDQMTITIAPAISGGTVGSNQNICHGGDPAAFTSSAPASGGIGAWTYQWQYQTNCAGGWTDIAGATGLTYDVPAGLTTTTCYRRQATNSCGIAYSNTITVTVAAALNGGTVGSDQNICYNADPAAFTSISPATGGIGAWTYQWQYQTNCAGGWTDISGATGLTYDPPAGLTQTTCYRRVATNSCGTAYSNTITVTVATALSGGTVGSDETICHGGDPAAFTSTAPASGGIGGWTYQWQYQTNCTGGWTDIAGATGLTYDPPVGLTQTTCYRRVATNSCGTAYSNTITITVAADMNGGTIASNQTICYNTVPAAFTSVSPATGGVGAITYQWQYQVNCVGAWNNIAGATNLTYTETAQLTQNRCYRRVAYSSCDTAYSNTITVTVNPQINVNIIVINNVLCHGGSTANAYAQVSGGTPPYTYLWSNGSTNDTLFNVPVGTYTVTVTDFNNCQATANVTITQPDELEAWAGSGATICYGSSWILGGDATNPTVEGGTPPYTYSWTSIPFDPSLVGQNTLEKPVVTPFVTTMYFLTVTDANGCQASDSATVSIHRINAIAACTDTVTMCHPNNGPGYITLGGCPTGTGNTATNGVPPYTYLWTTIPPSAWSSNLAHPQVSPTVPTRYRLRVRDASGLNCTSFDTVVVVVGNELFANATSTDNVICSGLNGGSTTLNAGASGGSGGYTYSWTSTPNDPSLFVGGQNLTANPTVSPTVSTVYTVEITDNQGCKATDFILITVEPQVIADAGNFPNMLCHLLAGETITLGGTPTATGTGPFSYQWFVQGNAVPFSNQANPQVSPATATTYIVRVIDNGTADNCEDWDTVSITFFEPRLLANATPAIDTICDGSNGGTLQLNATHNLTTGPYSFLWESVPNSYISNTTIANPNVMPNGQTLYIVTITDGNGCQAKDTSIINVWQPFTARINPNITDTTICHPGNGGGIAISITHNDIYPPQVINWYTSVPVPGMDMHAVSQTVYPTTNTTFIAEVIDAKGCVARDTLVVNVQDEFFALAAATDTIKTCAIPQNGLPVTLGLFPPVNPAGGSYTYQWTSNPPDPSLTGQATNPNPVVSPPFNNTYITYVLAVTNTVTGCVDRDTVVLRIYPELLANPTPDTIALCFGMGTTLRGNATGGCGGPYTYQWLDINGNVMHNGRVWNIPNGNGFSGNNSFIIRVQDACGCVTRDTVKVYWAPAIQICNMPSKLYFCANDDSVRLGCNPTVWGGGGVLTLAWYEHFVQFPFSNEQNPMYRPTLDSTRITLVVSSSLGCSTQKSFDVLLNDSLFIDNMTPATTQCEGTPIQIGPSGIRGGTPPYTYFWTVVGDTNAFNTTAMNPIVRPTKTATYYFHVRDKVNCSIVDSVVITVDPKIDATVNMLQQPIECGGFGCIYTNINGGTGAYTYKWYSGSTMLATTKDLCGVVAGTYRLIVTDGICSDTLIASLSDPYKPIIGLQVNDAEICTGEQLVLNAIGSTNINYAFLMNGHFVQNYSSQMQFDTIFNTLPSPNPVTFTLWADSANCKASKDTLVKVFQTPFVDALSSAPRVCQNAQLTLYTLNIYPNTRYEWYLSGNLIDTGTSIFVYPVDTGFVKYHLIAKNLLGGCNAMDSVIVHVDSLPRGFICHGPIMGACDGDSVTIGCPQQPGYSYIWSSDPIYPGLLQNVSSQTVRPAVSTVFFLNVTQGSTSCSYIDSVRVNLSTTPVATILSPVPPLALCEGGSVRLRANNVGAYTYSWDILRNAALFKTVNAIDTTLYFNLPGNYEARLRIDNGGCVGRDTVLFRIDTLPVANAGGPFPYTCSGDTYTIGPNVVVPGYRYRWQSIPNLPGLQTNVARQQITPTDTVILILTVTDTTSLAMCSSTDTLVMNVGERPIVPRLADFSMCPEWSVGLGAGSDTSYNYIWFVTPSGIIGPDTTAPSIIFSLPYSFPRDTVNRIIYRRVFVPGNDCPALDTIYVNVYNVRLANLNYPTRDTVCYKTIVKLGPDSSYNSFEWFYNWEHDTLPYIAGPTTPYFRLNVIDDVAIRLIEHDTVTGCALENYARINIFPTKIKAYPDTTICNGASVKLYYNAVTVGTYRKFWTDLYDPSWISYADTVRVTPLFINSGYVINLIDTVRLAPDTVVCQPKDTANIWLEIPFVAAGRDTVICRGGNAIIGNNLKNQPFTYQWYVNGVINHELVGDEKNIVSPNDTTYYVMVATSVKGCKSFDTIRVVPVDYPNIGFDIPGVEKLDEKTRLLYPGQLVTLTVTPDTLKRYEYYANDVLLGVDSTSGRFKTDRLMNGHTVRAVGISKYGCAVSKELEIVINDVPNAFTPFTVDGKNDIFMKGTEITILNRWGQKIFEGTDGWDGTYKGRPVVPGTYFYIITVRNSDNIKYIYKGAVYVVGGEK